MKVKLDKLTATTIEVEMPEICPNPECKSDLREEGALREDQYLGSERYGQIMENSDGEPFPECTDGYSYDYDTASAYVVAYACTDCGQVLVNSADAPEGA